MGAAVSPRHRNGVWGLQEVWQMSHGMNATARPSWRAGRQPGSLRPRSVLTTLVLLAGCLTSVVGITLVTAPAARADTVPPPPAGWTTVFGDNFAGPAGSAPSSSNWFHA